MNIADKNAADRSFSRLRKAIYDMDFENDGYNAYKKGKITTKDMCYTAMFAMIIAVCSWISIPMTVPFTLQTFGVFAALGVLGGKKGTAAVIVYVLLGVVGLPVFAGFKLGIGALLGTTGGYIIGFVLSGIAYWAITNRFGTKLTVTVIAMAVGLIVCYAFGTAWFMFVYTRSRGAVTLWSALGRCVFPFIIPDAVKIALAVFVSEKAGKYASLKKA